MKLGANPKDVISNIFGLILIVSQAIITFVQALNGKQVNYQQLLIVVVVAVLSWVSGKGKDLSSGAAGTFVGKIEDITLALLPAIEEMLNKKLPQSSPSTVNITNNAPLTENVNNEPLPVNPGVPDKN